jgi:hypothetical protein
MSKKSVSGSFITVQAKLHTLNGRKRLNMFHNAHEAIVAFVGRDVGVPTIGWGGVVYNFTVSSDRTGVQGTCVCIVAVKTQPLPRRADPMNLRRAVVK